ncbi:MAG: caspase family protein [Thermodesulfobacteriota bacterium]|nr:caspase family protein [Thermodesulfobacteriota bacterium]
MTLMPWQAFFVSVMVCCFQVKLLLERKATRKAIYQALRNLVSSTKPDENVLIYYAGHGDLDRISDDGWWIAVTTH